MAVCKDVITRVLNGCEFVHIEVLMDLVICSVFMSKLATLAVVAKLAFPKGAAVLGLEYIMRF